MDRMGLEIPGTESPVLKEVGRWPNGRRLAVGLTVDCYGSEAVNVHHMVASSLNFGPERGVWNMVEEFERFGAKATFNLPAVTARAHPGLARGLREAGHEVALLGEKIVPHSELDRQREKAIVSDSVAAMSDVLGEKPKGWRTPQCRPSVHTLPLLVEAGLFWDSSLRNDELPYRMSYDSGSIVEIPCGGSNDDSSYFGFPYPVTPADNVYSVWRDELCVLHEESADSPRMAIFSLTPGFAGRRTGLTLLRQILTLVGELEGSWVATCSQIADCASLEEI